MKLTRLALIALLGILLVPVIACGEEQKTEPTPTSTPAAECTIKENEEAELIALCLSGDIVAPDTLYDRVLSDLAVIRSDFGDEFEIVNNIEFLPPWAPGSLIIGFEYEGNATTAQMVANGTYEAWDELNEIYEVTEIDTGLMRTGGVLLHFKCRLHPRRLEELYEALPGVRYAEPNSYLGDYSNIYPRQIGDKITYLFRNAWGDCMVGCTGREYWYFSVEDGKPTFIGHYDPQRYTEPDWYDEADKNEEQYHGW